MLLLLLLLWRLLWLHGLHVVHCEAAPLPLRRRVMLRRAATHTHIGDEHMPVGVDTGGDNAAGEGGGCRCKAVDSC